MANGAVHGKKHAAATREPVRITGNDLTIRQVVLVARTNAPVQLSQTGRNRAAAAHAAILRAASQRPIYGQSTGVGANKNTAVPSTDTADHGLRLIRSHAAIAGTAVNTEIARAMLVVRLNQLAAGGSGVNPELLDVLEQAINLGLTPPITKYGAIGTGDLPALAMTMLCILGERQWRGGSMPAHHIDNTDALAFMSSSAATLGEAALACHDVEARLRAGTVIAALSFVALGGNAEALGEPVVQARPHQGQQAVAATLRDLLGTAQAPLDRRIQDPYSLRTLPQVHGAATDALTNLEDVLHIELNAANENPLVDVASGGIFHNGNFHGAPVCLGLDAVRAALYQTASLSAARISALMEPALTTLRPFLAYGPSASSGLLIAEYVAQSALAELRHLAAPDSLGGAVLSRGTEEHASFSTQAAWHTTSSVSPYETVLACELVAAVRALQQQNVRLHRGPLRTVYERAVAAFDPDMSDRPLDVDLAAAVELIRGL